MKKVIITQKGAVILAENFVEYDYNDFGYAVVTADTGEYCVRIAKVRSVKDAEQILSNLAEFIAADEIYMQADEKVFNVAKQGVDLIE